MIADLRKIGANHPDSVRSSLIDVPAILIGVTLVAATIFVAFRYAVLVGRMIGETGMGTLIGYNRPKFAAHR